VNVEVGVWVEVGVIVGVGTGVQVLNGVQVGNRVEVWVRVGVRVGRSVGVVVIVGVTSVCRITMGRYWTKVAWTCARVFWSMPPKNVNPANRPAIKTSAAVRDITGR
jgi:hypothetical protein